MQNGIKACGHIEWKTTDTPNPLQYFVLNVVPPTPPNPNSDPP